MTVLMILKSEKRLKKKNKTRQKTTLNNRLKNKTVITIIFQFEVCRFCFYFLSGILLLRQENEYYSKYL
jgi:dipeptide/tripeptide permease